MRRRIAVLLVFAGCGSTPEPPPRAVTATPTPAATVAGALPGATAARACAGAGDFWPTQTLALDGTTAWVACKEESRVISLAGAEAKLEGAPIAVLNAFGAVWALSDRGALVRLGDGREIDLEAAKPYNLWAGAGALWAIDDGSGEVIRVDPQAGRVVTKIAVGDGPADMVFAGDVAWVINHRDRGLIRLDTRTNRLRRLATLGATNTAPERMARLAGSLWITGRGADLLKVDPETGRVRDTIEIGGSGIDVIAAGGALWVPSRSEKVDQSGFPTMETLRRVTPAGRARVVAEPNERVDVHGLAADHTSVWLSDNTAGIVYRIALDR